MVLNNFVPLPHGVLNIARHLISFVSFSHNHFLATVVNCNSASPGNQQSKWRCQRLLVKVLAGAHFGACCPLVMCVSDRFTLISRFFAFVLCFLCCGEFSSSV